jgi:hypothetical protein
MSCYLRIKRHFLCPPKCKANNLCGTYGHEENTNGTVPLNKIVLILTDCSSGDQTTVHTPWNEKHFLPCWPATGPC